MRRGHTVDRGVHRGEVRAQWAGESTVERGAQQRGERTVGRGAYNGKESLIVTSLIRPGPWSGLVTLYESLAKSLPLRQSRPIERGEDFKVKTHGFNSHPTLPV